MSKMKLSFSLILAIFLVGILSTAAFAKDPYGLKPVQQNTDPVGIHVPFTGNSAAGDVAGTKFDLVLKDGTSTVRTYGTVAIDSSLKGAFDIAASILTSGKVYTVELYHADDQGNVLGSLLSKSTAVYTNSSNGNMYQVPDSHVDVNGTGLVNDNHTGYDNTRKNRSGQKIHGFYQNNTNSCASCHQTHTAANGESLLFKDGTYSTCSACHDGTTGAYNSFAPTTADTVKSASGTFNVHDANQNGSLHTADGSLEVSAAPGGNNNPDSSKVAVNTWGSEFDCASCHSAHGAGSAGENNLNTDPNGWGGIQYYAVGATKADGTVATKDDSNGKLFKNIPIYTTAPATFVQPFILVKTTASTVTTDKTKAGYLYSRAGVVNGDPIIQTYRWDGAKYVADYSLWLRDIGHKNAPFQNANTVLKDSTGSDITTTNMTVIWRDGFAFGTGVANVASADVSIGIDVETTSDIASLFDSTNKSYIVDSGTEMSKYCAACHTDYLSGTRTNNTGVYTVAHRHATAQDRLTCVRCHYGHGSEASIMKDANDNSYFDLLNTTFAGDTTKAISYFADPNPSSALKRYTGMSVCYACHGKGEAFLGNPNVTGDATTGQFLKNGDPGATRTDLPTRHNASGSDLHN
jgi:hypothetical protein